MCGSQGWGWDRRELSVAEAAYWFINPHLVENRKTLISHIPCSQSAGTERVFPDLPAEGGSGHPLRPTLGVSAVEEGHSSAFSPQSPGPGAVWLFLLEQSRRVVWLFSWLCNI